MSAHSASSLGICERRRITLKSLARQRWHGWCVRTVHDDENKRSTNEIMSLPNVIIARMTVRLIRRLCQEGAHDDDQKRLL